MSDRPQKVININAPLLKERAQIIRQRVGNAALTRVPTLHCTQRDVEIAGEGRLPAKPIEGFADSGELVAGHLKINRAKAACWYAVNALALHPLDKIFFQCVKIVTDCSPVANRQHPSPARVVHFFNVIIGFEIIFRLLGVINDSRNDLAFVVFNFRQVFSFNHIGLHAVLGRPIAVPCGHNIATNSVDCKQI